MGNSMYFAVNLRHIRQLKGLSQQALADKLEVPRSTLNNWERGTSTPAIETLILISKLFGVSLEDIMQIDLSSFAKLPERNDNFKVLTLHDNESPKGNIELVDATADAGYLENFNDPTYIKELPRIYFPNIPRGHFRGFEISGESMLPIEPGSVVICSWVENISDVKDGKSYVVASKEGLVYKRLYHDSKKDAFTMVSDNPLYMPYSLDYSEIKELWQFYAFLSFTDGKQMKDVWKNDQLEDVQSKISSIHKHILE